MAQADVLISRTADVGILHSRRAHYYVLTITHLLCAMRWHSVSICNPLWRLRFELFSSHNVPASIPNVRTKRYETRRLSEADSSPTCRVIRVTLASPEHAQIAVNSLSVDKELQPERCTKRAEVDGKDVVCTVTASDLRLLRISAASYFDMLGVVLRTLREFT